MEFRDIVSFKGAAALVVAALGVMQSVAAPGDDDYVADISMSHASHLEILSGSFKSANKYIRDNFEELVRKRLKKEGLNVSFEKFEIVEFSISDDARCNVKFKWEGAEK
jgi:hypothetical protein